MAVKPKIMECDRAFALVEQAAQAMIDAEIERKDQEIDVAETYWHLASVALIAAGVIERHPRGGWRRVPEGEAAGYIDPSLAAIGACPTGAREALRSGFELAS